jgi:hypothetical protein
MSKTTTGPADDGPHLTLEPSVADRVAALEAEAARESAAVRELEAKSSAAEANRPIMDRWLRFWLGLALGLLLGAIAMVAVIGVRR